MAGRCRAQVGHMAAASFEGVAWPPHGRRRAQPFSHHCDIVGAQRNHRAREASVTRDAHDSPRCRKARVTRGIQCLSIMKPASCAIGDVPSPSRAAFPRSSPSRPSAIGTGEFPSRGCYCLPAMQGASITTSAHPSLGGGYPRNSARITARVRSRPAGWCAAPGSETAAGSRDRKTRSLPTMLIRPTSLRSRIWRELQFAWNARAHDLRRARPETLDRVAEAGPTAHVRSGSLPDPLPCPGGN